MLAQRVATEMGVELGTTVGYSVRFSNASSDLTRIKYLTDGSLIRECMTDPLLSAYSVVLVDEAQDRSLATDTLLALLKKIQRKRPDFRVIVSSASLDAERFQAFFGQNNSVIVAISGQLFPVDTHYLPEPTENYVHAAVEAVMAIHKQEPRGDILVFLPGKDEVMAAISEIYEQRDHNKSMESLVPLAMHAGLPSAEQKAAFGPARAGTRKAVFSTNVAETSVTIDNVAYVVDCGFVKQRVFDPATGLDRLVTRPISKSSAKQRAGRAGRTRPGKVYRLYTHPAFTSSLFTLYDAPEVCRLSLTTMVLSFKALGVRNLVRFDYFQPPPPELLSRALENLVSLDAIDKQSGALTHELGVHLAELPLDPQLGTCLLNSVRKFACSREAVAAVAMLSLKESPFVSRQKHKADMREFMVQEGDVLTFVNTLIAYQETPERSRSKWCRFYFLNERLLEQASRISRQLEGYLAKMGYQGSLKSCGRNFEMLQRCLVSGLFANAARFDKSMGEYRLVRGNVAAYVHPSSVYFTQDIKPEYVVFASAMETTKLYMQGITSINVEWLATIAPNYFTISK
ncbi:hypothetical protein GGH12_002518 [Coemansia sp. RSA 1822]|nr:hypothetical protein LPJ76_005792 [Coemansia sp. RSA 638]KAJ2120194.1 hypothetical protein IW147_005265 [Coemansia sp. RSA 720]KAJ2541831.1 hypothetical protein GGF49_003357 [Coemansia sp. RSA 1853]KAJ2563544.1 hypothetical protein GGH12_002518 [Coemansia sp. RSA 1822]